MKDILEKLNRWYSIFVSVTSPERLLVLGYTLVMFVGFILLVIDGSQKLPTKDLDVFFTVISAVSTTGLTTVSLVDHYSFFGQLVTLLLFQIGGLGYMMVASFLFLTTKIGLSKSDEELVERDFNIPEGTDVNKFIKRVVFFTLAMELAGAIGLYFIFVQDSHITNPLWFAIYHSVSAFCTTGFTLFTDSFQSFTGDFWFNTIISILSVSGSIGFFVIFDITDKLFQSKRQLSYTSHIILRMIFIVIPLSTILIMLAESGSREVDTLSGVFSSFFLVMTSSTTVGFSTLQVETLSTTSLIIALFLMFMGASPAGTGGGLKVTNMATLLAVAKSRIKGHVKITFSGGRITPGMVSFAAANLVTYLCFLSIGLLLLTWLESMPIQALLFELISAFSTVGLSLGITPSLSDLSKLVVIIAMFSGRLGVLTFALIFYQKQLNEKREDKQEEQKQSDEEDEKEDKKKEDEKERKEKLEKKKMDAELEEKDDEIEKLKEQIEESKKDDKD